MDTTKFFETTDNKIEPLELAKLDAMIEHAMSYPQLQVPANQNRIFTRKAVAVAAAIVLAVTFSFQFMPAPVVENTVSQETVSSNNTSNDDVYGDVSELLMLETINDLSPST